MQNTNHYLRHGNHPENNIAPLSAFVFSNISIQDAKSFLNQAKSYHKEGKFTDAIFFYQKAYIGFKNCAKNQKYDCKKLYSIISDIAICYKHLGVINKSIEYLEQKQIELEEICDRSDYKLKNLLQLISYSMELISEDTLNDEAKTFIYNKIECYAYNIYSLKSSKANSYSTIKPEIENLLNQLNFSEFINKIEYSDLAIGILLSLNNVFTNISKVNSQEIQEQLWNFNIHKKFLENDTGFLEQELETQVQRKNSNNILNIVNYLNDIYIAKQDYLNASLLFFEPLICVKEEYEKSKKDEDLFYDYYSICKQAVSLHVNYTYNYNLAEKYLKLLDELFSSKEAKKILSYDLSKIPNGDFSDFKKIFLKHTDILEEYILFYTDIANNTNVEKSIAKDKAQKLQEAYEKLLNLMEKYDFITYTRIRLNDTEKLIAVDVDKKNAKRYLMESWSNINYLDDPFLFAKYYYLRMYYSYVFTKSYKQKMPHIYKKFLDTYEKNNLKYDELYIDTSSLYVEFLLYTNRNAEALDMINTLDEYIESLDLKKSSTALTLMNYKKTAYKRLGLKSEYFKIKSEIQKLEQYLEAQE